MNKKVLAIAVVAAMSASAAQADVKWGGALQAELASLGGDAGTTGLGFGDTFYGGGNKGGLAVSWKDGDAFGKIGFNVSIGGGTTKSFVNKPRDMFVGLKIGPGKVQLGRHSSLYKVTGGVKIDPFLSTGLQARSNGGQSAGQNGYISSARYSMKAGAVKFGVDFSPELIASPDGETAAGLGKTARLGIAASMDIGSVNVFFATDNHQHKPSTQASPESITKFGAKMKVGKMKLALQVESGLKAAGVKTVKPGADGVDDTLTFVSLSMPMGGMTLGAWVGIADKNGTSLSVGVKKSLSKKSMIYGGFRSTGHSTDKSSTAILAGLRTGF